MIRRLAFLLFLFSPLAINALNPSFTSVTSSPSPSIFGQPVTLTAAVSLGISFAPAANPTGMVTFMNGQTMLGTVPLVAPPPPATKSTATLTVVTLPAGQFTIVAIYSGDGIFSGSMGSTPTPQIVNKAPTNIAWIPNPSSLAVGAPLTAAQLNATASTNFTTNVPGTYTYKPAAGTVFNTPGPQTLTVAFTPTDAADFLPSASRAQINVIAFTLTSINPATATLNDPAKTVTFTGTGFTPTSIAQVNGNAIPTAFVNATTLTGTIPAIDFATVSTLQLSVADPQIQGTTNALPLPVTLQQTTTTLQSSAAQAEFGQPVTFTATVTQVVLGFAKIKVAVPAQTPTGTVDFSNATAKADLGSVPLANGAATLPGIKLPVGKFNITATYSGDSAFGSSMGNVGQTVTQAPTNIAWTPNPSSLAVGAPLTAAQLNATASTNFITNVPGTFTYKPAAGTVFNTPGPQTLTVTFTPTDGADFLPSASRAQINVTQSPLQIVLTGPSTTPSRTQPSLNFQLTNNPYSVPLDGIFTLTFTPAAGLTDDPMIKFINGSRTFPFTIQPNSTDTRIVQFQAGTVTGTITIRLTLSTGGVDVTPAGLQPVIIQVPPAPPALTSATMFQRNGKQVTVVIHGYSNTREVSTANFDFTAASGSIKNPNIALPVTTLFTQWYSSQPSDQYGSEFTYTQSFILNDDASHIRSVSVTLVNSIGASTPGSAQ